MAEATGVNDDRANRTLRPRQAAFAGRVGGNQEFIADADHDSLLEKQPDAAPLQSISATLDFGGFTNIDVWRMAFLEGVATMLLVFLLGSAANGLVVINQPVLTKTAYAALANWIALSIFIYCLGPVSGGHLNPTISLATFFAGLSTFPRTILYVAAQSIGAIVAGFLLKLCAGTENYFSADFIPGCTAVADSMSVGQMFASEFVFTFFSIFTAFGVGLDPRQSSIYGPAYAPVLVGLTLGLSTLCSTILRPEYAGASLNPARCLGLMTAKHDLHRHWINWVASLSAAMFNGLLYFIAPPWRRDDSVAAQMAAFVRSRHFRKHRTEHSSHSHHA